MKKDISYGIIPFKLFDEEWKVLLVRHVKKHWAFPKGHADGSEEPLEAAVRELKEETGLDLVSLISDERFQEHYFFTWDKVLIEKTVTYFPAIVAGTLVLEEDEVDAAEWLSLKDAEKRATFPETKKICRKLSALFLD